MGGLWHCFTDIIMGDAVDGCETLHQLVDGQDPILIPWNCQCWIMLPIVTKLVQDFFYPQYNGCVWLFLNLVGDIPTKGSQIPWLVMIFDICWWLFGENTMVPPFSDTRIG